MTDHAPPRLTAGRLRTSVGVTPDAAVALRPLGTDEVDITGGLWASRQQVNRSVSLLAAADKLEESGNLHNLRLVAGRATGEYRLPDQLRLPFLDSDVYKWLEAVGWELGRSPDAELERLADEVIELVAAAQGEDGYLNSYWSIVEPDRRWQDLANGHELYCAGHLIQAAVAHARGRGDDVLLGVACRFADHIADRFGEDRHEGVPGHPEIEMALVELWRLTGEARYLEVARYFVQARGRGLAGPHGYGATYFQDHQSVREATTVVGHAVRALYLEAGVVDVAMETGDEELLVASIRRWESMVRTKMSLTGGIGSRHQDEAFGYPFELPPDRSYNETCAAIASVMWSWRLLLATGDPRYADLIERTLYNAFLPGVSLDGQRYFYVNTLHARRDPDLEGVPTATWGRHERVPWYGCACCPPNVMRLLATMEHYLATVSDLGVQLHQYVDGRITAPLAGGELVLRVRTDYPWDGRVSITVEQAPDGPFELQLRVPAWADGASLTANAEVRPVDPGVASVRRAWTAGDEVVLDLPMPPRLTGPHPQVDAIRGTVAIERGPLVYAVESVDLPDDVELEDIILTEHDGLETHVEPDLLDGVVVVRATATVRLPVRVADLPSAAPRAADGEGADPGRQVDIRAIPHYAWGNRGLGGMRVWLPTS